MSFWQRAPRHKRFYRGPARDKKFKVFVRTFPCCACRRSPVHAAHTGTDGGKAQKASDRSCCPLCARCHRLYHDMGRKQFELKYGLDFIGISADLNAQFERRNMPYQSEAEWQRAEEAADARRHKRQQAELFDEFRQTTPEEREIAAYYAHQREVCNCHHILGMHDYPLGKCMEAGCRCAKFEEKQYDRFVLKPSGEIKPVASERGAGEEAA